MKAKPAREEAQRLVNEYAELLNIFRDDMADYFRWLDEEKQKERISEGKPEGYERRPTIGLQIQVEGSNRLLAIRPGFRAPRKEYRLDDPPEITRMGVLLPEDITLELLAPGKQFSIKLSESGNKVGHAYNQDGPSGKCLAHNVECLHEIIRTIHKLLKAPWETFQESGKLSDRCCCCRRELTEPTSRTRGIGPECIARFAYFDREPSSAVKKYRQKYRNIDDPWDATGHEASRQR